MTIYAPADQTADIAAVIASVARLGELVAVAPDTALDTAEQRHILLNTEGISLSLDWLNNAPPYLLPQPIAYSPNNLLALVFFALGNYEEVYARLQDEPALLAEIDHVNRLQHSIQVSIPDMPSGLSAFDEYRYFHNAAITAQYGQLTRFHSFWDIKDYFQRAMERAPNDEFGSFTGIHFASLLLDADILDLADDVLAACYEQAISEEAQIAVKQLQYNLWIKQLQMPYDPDLMQKTKDAIWQVLKFSEKRGNQVQVGLVLVDAAHVANLDRSFSEALGYINRAIDIFEEEKEPQFAGNAHYTKGRLLFTWAILGNPQFLKPATQAYQEAVKVFRKDTNPDVYAQIQHHLGVLYSIIPDEAQKKSMWAAISVGAFKEALRYFTKETHPYDYAQICSSYANALTQYPPAVQSDNHAKALHFYREALSIRTAEDLPKERALTIINFLDAAWHVQHANDEDQHKLFAEMESLLQEVKHLTDEEDILEEAELQAAQLEELRKKL